MVPPPVFLSLPAEAVSVIKYQLSSKKNHKSAGDFKTTTAATDAVAAATTAMMHCAPLRVGVNMENVFRGKAANVVKRFKPQTTFPTEIEYYLK